MSEATADFSPDPGALNRKMELEIAKLFAETAKIAAETSRINREARAFPWLPLLTAFIGSTGMTAVIGAIVALVVTAHK